MESVLCYLFIDGRLKIRYKDFLQKEHWEFVGTEIVIFNLQHSKVPEQ